MLVGIYNCNDTLDSPAVRVSSSHGSRLTWSLLLLLFYLVTKTDPWPIFIEDFHGRTHEVILTPGDMLFYESSKCFHGRPKRLNGSWYSSVFVHYYPKHGWFDQNHELEAHFAVPLHWGHTPPAVKQYQSLELVGTALKEPGCPNEWCRSQDTVKWSGPGEAGVWIAPTFERYPFEPQEVVWNEEL